MTIQDKAWLAVQITRMSLNGLPQEVISHELHISEGTVNTIMKELIASDETLTLQHEIAVVSKKTGMSIKQLASNLSFFNAMKRIGFEENKIQLFARALDSIFSQDQSLVPETAANLVFQVCNFIVKNGITLDKLNDEVERKYCELNKLSEQINEAKKIEAELQNEKEKTQRKQLDF